MGLNHVPKVVSPSRTARYQKKWNIFWGFFFLFFFRPFQYVFGGLKNLVLDQFLGNKSQTINPENQKLGERESPNNGACPPEKSPGWCIGKFSGEFVFVLLARKVQERFRQGSRYWLYKGAWPKGKKAVYLSVNVFSTKVLMGETMATGPRLYVVIWATRQCKGRSQNLHCWVILRPRVLVRSRESNLRPPTLQSHT